jgi:hypothetical protein
MVFDRFLADFQDQSDCLSGLAFGQQLENFALERGQLLERAGEVGDLLQGEFLEEPAADFPAKVG